MEERLLSKVRVFAPNLINICVDERKQGEISGRLYHCYTPHAILFSNVVELLRHAEALYDSIAFPQASTKTRSFGKSDENRRAERPEKVQSQEAFIEERGAIGTFLLFVQARQNATWQGEVYWMEQDKKQYFTNVLDFVKIIDHALI